MIARNFIFLIKKSYMFNMPLKYSAIEAHKFIKNKSIF